MVVTFCKYIQISSIKIIKQEILFFKYEIYICQLFISIVKLDKYTNSNLLVLYYRLKYYQNIFI